MAYCDSCGTPYASNRWAIILQPVRKAADDLHVAILRNIVDRALALSKVLGIKVRDEDVARWTAEGFNLLSLWNNNWEERAFSSLAHNIEYELKSQVSGPYNQFEAWDKCAKQLPDNAEVAALRDKCAAEYSVPDTTLTIFTRLNCLGEEFKPFRLDSDISYIRKMFPHRYNNGYVTEVVGNVEMFRCRSKDEYMHDLTENSKIIRNTLQSIAELEDTDVMTPESVPSVKPLLPLADALIASIEVAKEQAVCVE